VALITTGRIILGLFFLLAGVSKIMNPQAVIEMMAGENFPTPTLLLPLVVALEIFGGALLIWGRKFVVPVALTLAAFTLVTNLAFHRFWSIEDALLHRLELSLFFKNLAIMGGLFLIAGYARSKASPTAKQS
jgi:putative oxidoreductase